MSSETCRFDEDKSDRIELETSSIMREFYAKGVGLVKQDFPETLQEDSPVKEEVLLVKKRPASSAASQE
jgi:hypothetical protein